ncbi:MAG: tetratricopeptide repeat protein [Acidobacteriia bacterium]|nr:tetratricopeptide repeat protein [Terriglobia bacterium]
MSKRSILTMLVLLATGVPRLSAGDTKATYKPPDLPPQEVAVVAYDRHSGVEVLEVDGLRFTGSFWARSYSPRGTGVLLAPGIHRLVVQWSYHTESSSGRFKSTLDLSGEGAPLVVDVRKGRRYIIVASYFHNGRESVFDGSDAMKAMRENAFKALGVQPQTQYPWLSNVFYDIHDATRVPDLCWVDYTCWEYGGFWTMHDPQFSVPKTMAKLDKEIASKPRDPVAYLYRGMAQYWTTAPDRSRTIADYNKAIELDPRFARAYFNRGWFLYGQGDYAGALSDLNKAIDLDPEFASAYVARGSVWTAKGDPDKSMADTQRAIEANACFVSAIHNRGVKWFQKGDYEKAVADQGRAVEISPKFAPGYIARGDIWLKKGEYDKAIADYTSGLAIDVESVAAYSGRGEAYWKTGNNDQAIADFNRAIQLDPKSASVFSGRGNVWYSSGDLDRAILDYTESLRLQADPVVQQNLALTYQKAQLRRNGGSQRGRTAGAMLGANLPKSNLPAAGPSVAAVAPVTPPAPVAPKIVVRGTLLYYPDHSPVAGKYVVLATASRKTPQTAFLLNSCCPSGGLACGVTDARGFVQLEVDPAQLQKSLLGQARDDTVLTVLVFMEGSQGDGTGVMRILNGRPVHASWDLPNAPGVLNLDEGGTLFLDYKKK